MALAVSGCSGSAPHPVASSPVAPAPAPATAATAPPAPELLADVVTRLADPTIPGADKVALVAGATDADAAALDGFARALRDGGYIPVTVTAADVGWSGTTPGDVTATIMIIGARPGPGGAFRFPLEFRPQPGGWQLTRDTADLLLGAAP